MTRKEIQTRKGHAVSATIYGIDIKTVLIIVSATGVKQEFYRKFAEYISSDGIAVITFDYHGIGSSLNVPIQSINVTAAEWGSNDLDAVIQWAIAQFPHAGISILGHSIGGQLIGLAPSSTAVKRIILVAAQTGYWKYWPGFRKYLMWLNWYLLFPVLTRLFGYLPSKKFSGMENLPAGVALQWSNWCRKRNYLFDDISPEEQYFHKISATIVVVSIHNDPLAPASAVDWLAQKYRSKVLKTLHLKPENRQVASIGHFGLFKEKYQSTIWQLFRNEVFL